MLSGARALLLFADGCPPPGAALPPTPALDRVVSQGVSGWLSLRRPVGCKGAGGAALGQILGVMPGRIAAAGGDLSKVHGFEDDGRSQTLREKYGGLEVRVVSTAEPALELSSLGAVCECAHAEGTDAGVKLAAQIRACFADAERPAHLVVLHLHSTGDVERSLTALRTLDAVAADIWQDGSLDMLQARQFLPDLLCLSP